MERISLVLEPLLSKVCEIPLHYIVIGFSLCGLLLVIVLVGQARQGRFANMSRYRSKEAGVADLLNWAAVIDDGVILNKNGSLMAAWIYRGPDNANATNTERNSVSKMINAAINQLGSGWMFHIDAIRWACPSYSPRGLSHFPDPVSQAIDDERRRLFEQIGTLYEGCYVLVATFFPPVLAQAKFVELMIDDPDNKRTSDSERGKRTVEQFKRDIDTLQGRLSSVLHMERLKGIPKIDEDGREYTEDDFLRWLHFCLTGINAPVNLPSNAAYIDCLIGAKELIGGTLPIIGDKYIKIVSIDNFPFESSPGILSRLAELPIDYRWSTRFIFLDQHEAIAMVEKYRRKWRQKIRGLAEQIFRTNTGQVNQDAMLMVQDCDEALLEVNSNVVAMGLFTSNVVLMDEDRDNVTSAALKVQKSLGVMGFPARIEDVNCMDAFFGTLPGHGVENVRRCLMNTRHVADMMPTSSIWTGEDKAPCDLYPAMSPPLAHCVTTGNAPFRLNTHVRDLGHTTIIGPTGAGKSVLLNTLEAQFLRYPGMTSYVFDRGNSAYTLCQAIGGQHYDIGGDTGDDDGYVPYAFCPLQFTETHGDRAWACSWIELLVELNNVKLTPELRNEIAARMESFKDSNSKSMLTFVTGLNSRELKSALEVYTRRGMMGFLLDADEDGLSLGKSGGYVVFEIESLMKMVEPRFILPVISYLFRRIEISMFGQPVTVFIDEAGFLLEHETFRNKIKDWLLTMRKGNGSVFLAMQSVSQAAESGILSIIRDSTASRIFLANAHAKSEELMPIYKGFGLNARQIDIISSAIPKRQYYLSSNAGNRLFELALGPLQLALTAVSDKDSVSFVKQMEVKHGFNWLYEWLRFKRIDERLIESIQNERSRWREGQGNESA